MASPETDPTRAEDKTGPATPPTKEPARESRGWLAPLLRRRLPQYVGVYLGASFGILQFISWATDRYLLSPYLPDLALCLLAFVLPSVLVHAWYHGEPGRNAWCRTEKLCLAANGLVGALVLLLIFGGKDLGSATTDVSLVNDRGTVTTRTVPKPEFRRQVALFPFTASPGDSIALRLRGTVPWLLDMDLLQDLFVHGRSDFSLDLARHGGDAAIRSPATLREIALGHRLDYFVSGSLESSGSTLRLTTRLYGVRHGTAQAVATFVGPNLFALVDSASRSLRRDLEIPSVYVDSTLDLPVESLTTSDIAALIDAAAGERALERRAWREAATKLRAAVRRDSTFAAAWGSLAAVYLVLNKADSAQYAVDRAMPLRSRLPEVRRTNLESVYFKLQGDREKLLRLAQMQVRLHPDDSRAHEALAWELRSEGSWQEALREYEAVLELAPDDSVALSEKGQILRRLGRPNEAITVYERYVQQHPRDALGLMELAALRLSRGELEQASSLYDQVEVIQPDDPRPPLGLADIARRRGHFAEALTQVDRAVSLSPAPGDRGRAARLLSDLYRMRGQVDSARAILTGDVAEPSAIDLVNEILSLEIEVEAGQQVEAWRRLHSVERQLKPPWDKAVHLGELLIYRGAGDARGTERSLTAARGALDFALGPQAFQPLFLAARGDLLRWKADCPGAIPLYQQSLEAEPEQSDVRASLASCLQATGSTGEARRSLEEGLALVPADPTLQVQMALLENQEGNAVAAWAHLQHAVDVWRAADPDFGPAIRARELLARWETQGQSSP